MASLLPVLITTLLIVETIVLPPRPLKTCGGVPVTSKGWEEVPLPAPVPSIYVFR
jgi:hypothetical protein